MLDSVASAKEIRDRLRNPPNGRQSSELDIVSSPILRQRRIQQIREAEKARRDVRWQEVIAAAVQRTEQAQARNSFISLPIVNNPLTSVRIPTVNQILAAVCAYYGISAVDIIAQRRETSIVRARHIAAYLAKKLTPRSFPEIGRRIGNRDHTTIIHSVRRVEDMLTEQPGLQTEIDELKQSLGCT